MSHSFQVAVPARDTSVLIIEDSLIDRELFRRLLQNNHPESFKSVECEAGRAALEQAKRIHPDCILLDLNLPDIDGLEVLHRLVRESDACPVIVMTAYGSEEIAVEAMKAGAADYLVKGAISAETLTRVIDNAIEKRALQRQIEEQRLAIEARNRELESALERYRVLTEAMPQLVFTADPRGGGWDYVNDRWTQLTGVPASDAYGDGWLASIDSQDRERITAAWSSAMDRTQPLEWEGRLVSSSGESRWQLMRAVPLFSDGLPIKWIGTLTDVDDQRRTEELLNQRQKLDSIGVLAGGVAHDFNNLLVGIIGGVSFALDVLPRDHELRSILQGAVKSGERAAELTRHLLSYAGKGAVQPADVSFEESLRSTWDLLQASIPRSVELRLAIPPDLPPIHTDATQLQQVIMNLILNAAEAIPDERQGIVVVRAEVNDVQAHRSTWSGDLAPGRYVTIEVRDNGVGIPPEVLRKVFDPFFTTKFTGRGLGLAAVYGIIRSNRGYIEVESTVGNGTAFRVYLRAGTASKNSLSPTSVAARASATVANILVVDDELVVRNMARAALARLGHNVQTASSGKEALDIIAASPARFSLVVLDFNMPGMTGEQTFDAIHSIRPDLPVLICSGYSEVEIRSRFANRAVAGYLQKPFRADVLGGRISNLLTRSAAGN
jgi:two-component system, cell cycle sensor histidine kinase and response regulator CckA